MVFLLLDDDKTTISLLQKTVAGLLPDVRLLTAGSIPEFEAIAQKEDIAVAFLETRISQTSVMDSALKLRQASPCCNIIFVSSHPEDALDAFRARPSGFITKPFTEADIRSELADLRHPLPGLMADKLRLVTFGAFTVYGKNNEILTFTRTRSKEILAYLVDQNGFPVTSKDIASDVLEEPFFDERVSKRVSKLILLLMNDLKQAGFPDAVIKQNRQVRINKDRVDCDLYRMLDGDPEAVRAFRGEYMLQYSWAETSDISGEALLP